MEGLNNGVFERMLRSEYRTVVFINKKGLGSNCHAIGMVIKIAKLLLQPFRGCDVVGVHPSVERRARATKPLIEMWCVPAVFLREDPNPGVAPREAFCGLKRAVG